MADSAALLVDGAQYPGHDFRFTGEQKKQRELGEGWAPGQYRSDGRAFREIANIWPARSIQGSVYQ